MKQHQNFNKIWKETNGWHAGARKYKEGYQKDVAWLQKKGMS
jgi:hypothetical protein